MKSGLFGKIKKNLKQTMKTQNEIFNTEKAKYVTINEYLLVSITVMLQWFSQ